jgi:hypothetical protein
MVREISISDNVRHGVLATQSQDHVDPIFKPVMVLAFAPGFVIGDHKV